VIYTSGTTGVPKGVMLSHGNIASNLAFSLDEFDFQLNTDLAVSFLPLSHITARHVDFALLYRGAAIAYCPFIEEMPRLLRQLHPTIFVAVPRVYEKIYNRVQRGVATGFKKRLYRWAIWVGRAHLAEVMAGKRPSSLAWRLANRLVFSKVLEAMGGRIRIFIRLLRKNSFPTCCSTMNLRRFNAPSVNGSSRRRSPPNTDAVKFWSGISTQPITVITPLVWTRRHSFISTPLRLR